MFDIISVFNAFSAGLCLGGATYLLIDKHRVLASILFLVACLNIVSVFA